MGPEHSSLITSDDSGELFVEEKYYFQPFICGLHLPEEDDKIPYPRSGHRIVCDEGNFYSYGGYNPQYTMPIESGDSEDEADEEDPHCLFPDVWKYNLALMKWRKLPVKDMPAALASNSVLISGKLMIVFGGTGVPFHLAKSNHLYVCNLEEEEPKFTEVEGTGQLPPPLYGQAIFMKDNYVYTMGGTTGFDYFLDIHRINLYTKEWEEVYINKGARNDPPGRYRHELAVVNDKVYVVGGGIGREAFSFEQIPVFDTKLCEWDTLITLRDRIHGYPSLRQYHSVVRIPETNSFVMAGGMHNTQVLDDTWRLDIPSMQWTKISTLRLGTPVYFHASCVTPAGKMYTFGGVSKTPFDTQERVSHVQSAWITIPKLKEICWEAVVDYGLIDHLESESELASSLPPEFCSRLIL